MLFRPCGLWASLRHNYFWETDSTDETEVSDDTDLGNWVGFLVLLRTRTCCLLPCERLEWCECDYTPRLRQSRRNTARSLGRWMILHLEEQLDVTDLSLVMESTYSPCQ